MGGSAGGGNAQLFQLMSQYGGEGGAAAPQRSTQQRLQGAMDAWMKSGGKGIFAPWSAVDGNSYGGGGGGGKGNGNGGNPTTPPANPPTTPEKFAWQFPQYTQSWAFTPPTPTPYEYPQPFDTKKYDNPFNKKNVKKNT